MKRWQLWVGLIISAFFLYLTLRGMKFAEIWQAFKQANFWWLLPGIAIYFVGLLVRSWRWHYMLRPIKDIPSMRLFPIVTMGYMANNIFPARAGEILRAVFLKQREGVGFSVSLATILAERVFDGVVMLAFVFINLPELSKLTGDSGFLGNIRELTLVGTGVFFGALIVFLMAAMFPSVSERIVFTLTEKFLPLRWREKVRGFATRFLSGLAALRSPADALMIFGTTVLIWLIETVKYWFVMHAFPFQVSFFALMLMNGIVNLTTTLPSAPGYIGTFDAPGKAILQAYGVNGELAVSYTLLLHAALWLPVTLVGAYFYFRQPMRVGKDIDSDKVDKNTITPITG
jgi:glycosyltransferase 2 family protein